MKTQQKYRNWLIAFTTTWFLVWTFLPIWLLKNDYLDILENLVWSRHFQFGYDKDPFLGAWITRLGYHLSGNHIWSAYILSQISVLICFWTIWRLGKKILSPAYALLAVLFLVGIQFYSIKSIEFNDDVLELALWALTCFYFYDAVKNQKLTAWILTGLFAGLSFMDKYYGIMLFIPMLFFLFINQHGRHSWHKLGVYIAAGIFLLISLPNLIWLWQHNFVAIKYIFYRTNLTLNTVTNIYSHIISPARYLSSILFMLLPAALIFIICFWRRKPKRTPINKFDYQYLTILCFGPFVCTFLFALITGGCIKNSWNTPLFSLLGIFIFTVWQPQLTTKKLRCYAILTAIMFLFWILVYCWSLLVNPYFNHHIRYQTFPGKVMAATLTKDWHEQYHRPVKYVAAERKLVCNFAVYSSDKPTAFFSWDTNLSPWINIQDIKKQGAIFLWEGNPQLPDNISQRFPTTKIKDIYYFEPAVRKWLVAWFNFKKMAAIKINVAFLPPASMTMANRVEK